MDGGARRVEVVNVVAADAGPVTTAVVIMLWANRLLFRLNGADAVEFI